MHGIGVAFLFAAALLTAAGYGGTFLLTEHFRALGGGEIETGKALGGAMIGTFVGVPLVGWVSARLGGARLAAAGALLVAIGYFMFANLGGLSSLIAVAGFILGMGWGMFYLAAPMAVSERITDADRGFWFTRLGAFQMAGIGVGPVLALFLMDALRMSTTSVFRLLALACAIACVFLWLVETMMPRPPARFSAIAKTATNWVSSLRPLTRTRSIYPIIMVGLGACVFTGMMSFQSSLVRGTGLAPGTYFSVYALVVVVARFTLAPAINKADGNTMSVILLTAMSTGVLVYFAVELGLPIQAISAILLGIGYGLVYTVIQTQVVNEAPEAHRTGALTWFVIAYFIGIFGFPVIGGWLIVNHGTSTFLSVVLACALLELGLAVLRNRTATPAVLQK
jgi:MFS family permease